jgi:hypothetical protein
MTIKLVLLHWKDAVTPTQGWTDINELETELAECVSVGFVVEENNETITIVSHMTGDKEGTDIDGSLVLDKSWIKHREDLVIPYTPDFDITGTIQSWLEKRNA